MTIDKYDVEVKIKFMNGKNQATGDEPGVGGGGKRESQMSEKARRMTGWWAVELSETKHRSSCSNSQASSSSPFSLIISSIDLRKSWYGSSDLFTTAMLSLTTLPANFHGSRLPTADTLATPNSTCSPATGPSHILDDLIFFFLLFLLILVTANSAESEVEEDEDIRRDMSIDSSPHSPLSNHPLRADKLQLGRGVRLLHATPRFFFFVFDFLLCFFPCKIIVNISSSAEVATDL